MQYKYKDSISINNYYLLDIPTELHELVKGSIGSHNVITARLLGLSYPDFLIWVNQKYDALIVGKKGYSYPVFTENKAKEFIKFINNHINDCKKIGLL